MANVAEIANYPLFHGFTPAGDPQAERAEGRRQRRPAAHRRAGRLMATRTTLTVTASTSAPVFVGATHSNATGRMVVPIRIDLGDDVSIDAAVPDREAAAYYEQLVVVAKLAAAWHTNRAGAEDRAIARPEPEPGDRVQADGRPR